MDDVAERSAVGWVSDSLTSARVGCFQADPPYLLRAGVPIGVGTAAAQMIAATQGRRPITSLFAAYGSEGIHEAPAHGGGNVISLGLVQRKNYICRANYIHHSSFYEVKSLMNTSPRDANASLLVYAVPSLQRCRVPQSHGCVYVVPRRGSCVTVRHSKNATVRLL